MRIGAAKKSAGEMSLNQMRWQRFRGQTRASLSLWLLIVLGLFSVTAEMWSNSRPVVLKFQGSYYFPVFRVYHPSRFGNTEDVVTDYRQLKLEPGRGDWAIWPPNRWDPYESNKQVERYPAKPSHENFFGTDDRGRDVFARLLYGYRYSMAYAILVWALTVIVAVALGGLMGFFGGWTDIIGQRLVEVLSSVPTFFLLIILVSIFEPSLTLLVLLTSLFSWIGLSYYIRAEFLKNRKREYVEGARAAGGSNLRLMFKHILPNSLVPVITFSPFIIASHIQGLASLDYLGFGLREPTPSWGELLNQAQKNFTIAWWLAAYPSIALFATLVLLGLVGDGVRNAFDPKKS